METVGEIIKQVAFGIPQLVENPSATELHNETGEECDLEEVAESVPESSTTILSPTIELQDPDNLPGYRYIELHFKNFGNLFAFAQYVYAENFTT